MNTGLYREAKKNIVDTQRKAAVGPQRERERERETERQRQTERVRERHRERERESERERDRERDTERDRENERERDREREREKVEGGKGEKMNEDWLYSFRRHSCFQRGRVKFTLPRFV